VTKVWRFRKSYTLDYTLSEVEEDILQGIFLKLIKLKSLGVSLKYYDSLVKKKLKIETDGELRVSLTIATYIIAKLTVTLFMKGRTIHLYCRILLHALYIYIYIYIAILAPFTLCNIASYIEIIDMHIARIIACMHDDLLCIYRYCM